MAVLLCKLPGEIRVDAGIFSDGTTSTDENLICWNTQDCSVMLYKPKRGRCTETDEMRQALCSIIPVLNE